MRKCKNTSPSVTGKVGTDPAPAPAAVFSILSLRLLSSMSEYPPDGDSGTKVEDPVPVSLLRVKSG